MNILLGSERRGRKYTNKFHLQVDIFQFIFHTSVQLSGNASLFCAFVFLYHCDWFIFVSYILQFSHLSGGKHLAFCIHSPKCLFCSVAKMLEPLQEIVNIVNWLANNIFLVVILFYYFPYLISHLNLKPQDISWHV